MSCQIKGIANFTDPVKVKKRLIGDFLKKFEHVPENELPLQNCHISLSPAGDIMALAWNTHLVILASKWDSQEEGDVKKKFQILWDGDVTNKQGEWLTSVICLPLILLGKINIGFGSDWTCIAVGFNTGFIKFFTENGEFLFEEQLQNESVVSIKCQTQAALKGDRTILEEVHVAYSTSIYILQGFALFSTLRAFRNHLARVKANCDTKPPLPNIVCKKWSFKNQDILNDCEIIGSTTVNTFDHLVRTSLASGFNTNYRTSTPQHSLVMACGKRPFIGFHYALEGGTLPVLSDVAIAMASKVASAIGSAVPFFRSGSKTSSGQEKVKISEPAEPMICKFGLCDVMREGECILVSPNRMLSVICDAMGRVILIDNMQGIALRMWKGYRDAQCAWIESEEERSESSSRSNSNFSFGNRNLNLKRSALFLVIYAPKKGVIDIWSIQHGAKITTFSASRNGRLLYINYGLCGLNNASSSGNKPQHPCVFIDPLGGVKEILVPFHFALDSHNGSKARDMHLLKKLKTFLKEDDFGEEKLINEIKNICTDLKTYEVRLQTIQVLISEKQITPDSLLAAAKCFSKQIYLLDEDDMDPETRSLYQTVTQLKSIIEFYKYIKSQNDQPPDYDKVTSAEVPDDTELSFTLTTSVRDVERMLTTLEKIKGFKNEASKSTSKVKFKDDNKFFVEFLSCFQFGTSVNITLQNELSIEKKNCVSKLIFQGWMYSNDPISNWKDHAKASKIHPSVLMEFALTYWLTRKPGESINIELINFTKILNAISLLNEINVICSSYNEVSNWWKEVRNILVNSQNPVSAYTAAVACRAVVINVQKNKDYLQSLRFMEKNGADVVLDESDSKSIETNETKEKEEKEEKSGKSSEGEEHANLISDWENVSKDTCQFSLLIGNLEDIAILEAIVSNPPSSDYTTRFYVLPYEKLSVSLGLVLSRGNGSVSEIVARWLSSAGIDPSQLIDENDIEFHLKQKMVFTKKQLIYEDIPNMSVDYKKPLNVEPVSVDNAKEAYDNDTSVVTILDKLSILKRYFPYSLSSSVLLANLCWEFVMAWNKDIKQLEALEAALTIITHIPVKRVRHGVCCLLWNLHMKKRMEAATKLLNKLGKLPKEILCLQDIGLTDTQLVTFLQHCVTFLSYFLDAEVLQEENCSFIRPEPLWEGFVGGPLPFASLAISQNPAEYDLIILHLQLANVLYMMAHFNLKVSKPLINLFDSMARQHFFQDITDKAMISFDSYKDEKRDSNRVEFLCRVITASMECIHQETTEANSYSSTQAILWMSKCQNQARMWKINNDDLRIHQLSQLYINSFDRLAEEAVIAVNDTEKLALTLLPIAGRRMMSYLDNSPDLLEEIATISPTLMTYLKSLKNDSNIVLTNCSNEDTVELVKKIVRFIPETNSDYYRAQLMLDATFIYEKRT